MSRIYTPFFFFFFTDLVEISFYQTMFYFYLSETPMTSMEMTRKSLYDVIKQCSDRKIDQKFEFLENRLKLITKCPKNNQGSLRSALKQFKYQFKQKWTAASNKEERFLKTNEQWLKTFITLPAWTTKKAGRPIKEFKELSDQAKRRKTKDLREQIPCEELTYAAQMSQRAAGHGDAAKVMKDMTLTPTRAKKYRTRYNSTQNVVVKKHTPSQALYLFSWKLTLQENNTKLFRLQTRTFIVVIHLLKRLRKTVIRVKSQ